MKIERLSKNLMDWPEITAFCLELRKSFLKSRYPSMDDNNLIKKIFSDNCEYEGKKMGVKETLTDQLKRIVQFLNKQKIDYALAGGLAFSALVEPRATMDIDLIVMVKEKQLNHFKDLLKQEFESIINNDEIDHGYLKYWEDKLNISLYNESVD